MAESKNQIEKRKIAGAGTGELAKLWRAAVRGCGGGRIHRLWWSTFFCEKFTIGYVENSIEINQDDILSKKPGTRFFPTFWGNASGQF